MIQKLYTSLVNSFNYFSLKEKIFQFKNRKKSFILQPLKLQYKGHISESYLKSKFYKLTKHTSSFIIVAISNPQQIFVHISFGSTVMQ